MALTNEQLSAERLPHTQNALSDHAEAVCIANLRYTAGSMDLLSVLQPQEGQIESQAELIKLLNAELADRISLLLALGGSFDNSPATESPTGPCATNPWCPSALRRRTLIGSLSIVVGVGQL